jgi:hypothetical protein
MAESVGHIIQDLTEGKSYVFVIMNYNADWAFYKEITDRCANQIK